MSTSSKHPTPTTTTAATRPVGVVALLSSLTTWLLVFVDKMLWPFRLRPRVDIYYCDDETLQQSEFNLAELVLNRCPTLTAGFRSAWWLPVGDTQTVYSAARDFSQVDPITYERKLIQVADGGLLAIDITPPTTTHPIRKGEVVIAVAHGLTGGSNEHYVRAALTQLTSPVDAGGLGARGVVLNYRGCNGSPVITPKLYHAGSSDDYGMLVSYICHTFPESKVLGLGFSLGGNILAKYVGEQGAHCPLTGVVTLANPWDFKRGSEHIEDGSLSNRHVYRYVMGGALLALYKMHRKVFLSAPSDATPMGHTALEKALRNDKLSLKEFDDLVTSPIWGFDDARHYYSEISSSKVAAYIQVPLLSINARDDPMVADLTLPLEEIKKNPWVVVAATFGGGHMGWFEQLPDGTIGRWYSKPVTEFFIELLKCDLPTRPTLGFIVKDGWVRQQGSDDIAFLERNPNDPELVFSGHGESKLLSGF